MRATRHKISLLKNRISEILPDDHDIFGYAGISKTLILDSLNESYNSLLVLDEYNDRFAWESKDDESINIKYLIVVTSIKM